VKENIAGGGDGVASAGADFAEGMQFGGTRGAEEAVPGVGTEPGDTGEASFDVAEFHGADESGEARAKLADVRAGVFLGPDADHQKYGGSRQRTGHGLRENDLV
jgi:hypothetical protein